jgi:hypothetical protein
LERLTVALLDVIKRSDGFFGAALHAVFRSRERESSIMLGDGVAPGYFRLELPRETLRFPPVPGALPLTPAEAMRGGAEGLRLALFDGSGRFAGLKQWLRPAPFELFGATFKGRDLAQWLAAPADKAAQGLMQLCWTIRRETGVFPSHLVGHPDDVDGLEAGFSYEWPLRTGESPVFVRDDACPRHVVFALSAETWCLHTCGPAVQLLELATPGSIAGTFGNLLCLAPCRNGVLVLEGMQA